MMIEWWWVPLSWLLLFAFCCTLFVLGASVVVIRNKRRLRNQDMENRARIQKAEKEARHLEAVREQATYHDQEPI